MLKWSSIILLLISTIYIFNTQPPSVNHQLIIKAASQYKARIIRDDFGVPHIYGERDMDVAYGLAYAHGTDDFSTLQDILLAVRGNLSAKNGMKATVTDYLVQWMGVWEQVNEHYEQAIPLETREVVEAYAAGINSYAIEHPEEVDPWLLPVRGQDVVAGFVFKTPLFYGFDKALAALAEGKLGKGLDLQTTVQISDELQPQLGSQGIAINRTRSADKAVRLVVNSHQPLTGPVAWYEARLKSGEGIDIVGGTFPGSPFILNGSGPALGWSSTVNKPDLIDIYQLTINPDNDNQYWMDEQWHELEETEASIRVKIIGPLYWTAHEPIFHSVHGPVMKFDHGSYAVRWAGMDEIRQASFYHKINRAKSFKDFIDALAMKAMPSINFVYADHKGNIANFYNAMMPDRSTDSTIDWQSIIAGDNSALIWNSYVAADKLPHTINPESGAVFNANNTPFVSTDGEGAPLEKNFPQWMGIEKQMTNRAYQIKQLLSENSIITAEKLHGIKMDVNYSPLSAPIMVLNKFLTDGLPVELKEIERYQLAFEHLKHWDLNTDKNNTHAALGVLTITPIINHHMFKTEHTNINDNFKFAVDSLHQFHGKIDVLWGEVNRLVRGSKSWPLSGGPDILRAVYGWPLSEDGKLINKAGDSYIQFAQWKSDGVYQVSSINTFGAAMTRPTSIHYSDQSPLFAAGQERVVEMDIDKLLKIALSDEIIDGLVKD
ncbi:MAG: penicillin amidase [Gammaproteobacteria bacterium]|nr:MAG: penicillin amidase [Gammaproteobacteria bacterium]